MTEPVEHLITDDAWTRVAFNASQAIIMANPLHRLRAHIGPAAPPVGTSEFFTITGIRTIRGIKPFDGLYLRTDTAAETEVTVYAGNDMSGVLFFGKSPFRLRLPGQSEISLPYVPQVLDGGRPTTDYTGLAVIDCGGVIQDPAVRTIDGRIAGEAP